MGHKAAIKRENIIKVHYMHVWKYQNETLYTIIMPFKNKKVKQIRK
jgi:hypothetical protein